MFKIKNNKLDLDFQVDTKNMNIWFREPGVRVDVDRVYLLDEELDKMNANEKISYVPMNCDKGYLDKFIEFLKNKTN